MIWCQGLLLRIKNLFIYEQRKGRCILHNAKYMFRSCNTSYYSVSCSLLSEEDEFRIICITCPWNRFEPREVKYEYVNQLHYFLSHAKFGNEIKLTSSYCFLTGNWPYIAKDDVSEGVYMYMIFSTSIHFKVGSILPPAKASMHRIE